MGNDNPRGESGQPRADDDLKEPRDDGKAKPNGAMPHNGKSPKGERVDPAPKPWGSYVDGAQLLDDMVAAIKLYLSLPPMAAELMALWNVGTHVAHATPVFPRLLFTSIDANCGKTQALDVLECLCFRPVKADDMSQAAIYRLVDAEHPTLLLDEADTWLTEHYRGLLNSGHKSNGSTWRCEENKDGYEPRKFSTYAPMAIARIGSFGRQFGPLLSRCLAIRMSRSRPDEALERLTEPAKTELKVFARKIQRWLFNDCPTPDPNPKMPDSLKHRNADNWRFLFSIAHSAGGHWPQTIRDVVAALGQSDDEADNADKRGIMSAIKSVLDRWPLPVIPTVELCRGLSTVDSYRYSNEFKNVSDKQMGHILRRRLAEFSELPKVKKIRIGEETKQGYDVAPFRDFFIRYNIRTAEEVEAELDGDEG